LIEIAKDIQGGIDHATGPHYTSFSGKGVERNELITSLWNLCHIHQKSNNTNDTAAILHVMLQESKKMVANL
jgi:hypothetical protein